MVGKKRAPAKKFRHEEEEDDLFENGSDVPLSDDEEDEDDEDIDDIDQEEEMFALSDEDDEEDEDDEDEDIPDPDNVNVKLGWGKKKQTFYAAGDDDELEDDEAAAEEEEEAREIRKKKVAALKPEDFEDQIEDDESKGELTLGERAASVGKKKQVGGSSVAGLIADGADGASLAIERLSAAEAEVLSKEEKLELLRNDSPELFQLLEDFKENINVLKTKIVPLLQRVKKGDLPTTKGISFLELKFHLLLSYCMNISFYLLLKAEGKSIKDHPVIDSLVRIRTLIEKLRPLDKKLKYQVDKLVKLAVTEGLTLAAPGAPASIDALKFKPNPKAMLAGAEEKEDKKAKKKTTKKKKEAEEEEKPAKYVPPRVAARRSEEEAKAAKQMRKAEKSSMLAYLRDQYSERPEEMASIGSSGKTLDEADLERQRYEEEYFLRMADTKQDKKKKKQRKNISSLEEEFGDLEDFNDLAGLDIDTLAGASGSSAKRGLSDILNNIQKGGVSKKTMIPGDEDVPYRDLEAARKHEDSKKRKRAAESAPLDDIEGGAGDYFPLDPSGITGADLDDDDIFGGLVGPASKKNKKQKRGEDDEEEEGGRKKKLKSQRQVVTAPMRKEDELDDGKKRKITYQIEKNKGLTPYRKKENRNPRVKHKKKFEKAQKKMNSSRPKMADKSKPYGGERTGIKASVTRSVPLKG